jgi:hypothetical protein
MPYLLDMNTTTQELDMNATATKIDKTDALYAAIEWINCYEGGEPGEGMHDALKAACLILAEEIAKDIAATHKRAYLSELKKQGKKIHPNSRDTLDSIVRNMGVDSVNLNLDKINNNLPVQLERV